MTDAERNAYNAGIAVVLALARRTALAIEQRGTRPLHDGFATEALRALADEAEALLLPQPSSGGRVRPERA